MDSLGEAYAQQVVSGTQPVAIGVFYKQQMAYRSGKRLHKYGKIHHFLAG